MLIIAFSRVQNEGFPYAAKHSVHMAHHTHSRLLLMLRMSTVSDKRK